jgi:hypothetical protein
MTTLYAHTSISRFSALLLALGLVALPAVADSSSVSSASSASLGSVSTSLETSSNSSTGKKQVAQGAYTLLDMVAVADKPDMLRLRMQGQGPDQTTEFTLLIPRQTAERAQLVAGQTVHALARTYGVAFAATDKASPFFLVMDDAVYREVDSRPVGV